MKIFKIAALSLAMATPLAAQEVEPYVDLFTDAGITARLTESGYSDVAITRDGTKLRIDATRAGAKHNLVYDMTTGALIEVDGAGYTIGAAPGTSGEPEGGSTSEQGSD